MRETILSQGLLPNKCGRDREVEKSLPLLVIQPGSSSYSGITALRTHPLGRGGQSSFCWTAPPGRNRLANMPTDGHFLSPWSF